MLNILQSLFIVILTPVSKVSGKLDNKVRTVCIQIVCFLLPLNLIYYYIGLRHTELFMNHLASHNARHLVGCLCLLLLIVFSLDRTPGRVKWNPWIMYPMIICGIWMMIVSFLHPVGDGYRAFAMMLIIAFPCLYFVWNNRGDYENLFDPLAIALSAIGILFFLSCFYLALKGELLIVEGRCTGLMANANLFSMVGMSATCGSLYLFVKDKEFALRFVVYSIALGSGLAVVLMGQSRISMAVCFCSILVTLFFYLRYSDKSKVSLIVLKLSCIIGCVVTIILLSHLCVLLQTEVESHNNPSMETEQEANSAPVETLSALDRFSYDENTTLEIYTAGRYHIWKGYMQYLNLLGNDFSKADWDVLTQGAVRHAHNNFFEMAYRFGIPLGILFIVLEVIACIKALLFLFVNRKRQLVLLLPILFVVMYFFESMFDVATLPFERDAPLYCYFALIPMVDMDFQYKQKNSLVKNR